MEVSTIQQQSPSLQVSRQTDLPDDDANSTSSSEISCQPEPLTLVSSSVMEQAQEEQAQNSMDCSENIKCSGTGSVTSGQEDTVVNTPCVLVFSSQDDEGMMSPAIEQSGTWMTSEQMGSPSSTNTPLLVFSSGNDSNVQLSEVSQTDASLKQKSPDWDENELETLVEAVKKYGTNWRKVLSDPEFKARFKPERTCLSLKTKWFRAKGTPAVVQKLGLPRRKNQDLAENDHKVLQYSAEPVPEFKQPTSQLAKKNSKSNRTKVSRKIDFIKPVVTFKQIQQLYCQNPPSQPDDVLQNRKRKAEESFLSQEYESSTVGEQQMEIPSTSVSAEAACQETTMEIEASQKSQEIMEAAPVKRRKLSTKGSSKPTRSTGRSKIFHVEKILSHRFVDGVLEFYLRWMGFDSSHDSWEPVNYISPAALKSLLPKYYSDGEGMSLPEICKIAKFVANPSP
jgi:hypothetical protein